MVCRFQSCVGVQQSFVRLAKAFDSVTVCAVELWVVSTTTRLIDEK
jgi:hypothetical protein